MSNKFNKTIRPIVINIIQLIHDTDDKELLHQLEKVTWELKPSIERPNSNIDPALGKEIWLYAGVKKDANPEMANECGKNIDYWFKKTKPPWNM